MRAEDVWALDAAGWRALMREGHPIEPGELAGWTYRGTSLGMPALVERASWKTFQKCFHLEGEALRGWNVRLVQDGGSEPMRDRAGTPRTFGHFVVHEARERGVPHGFDRGVLLDYGVPGASRLDPLARLRDPVIALRAGDAELLLGWSYLVVAGRAVDTPSFFTLERESRTTHVPPRPW